MNNYNGFDLFIFFVFNMSHQLVGIGPEPQDLLIYFHLGEGKNLPQFHLSSLQIICKLFLLQDQTAQINNITGKYIMELSKL